MHFRKFLFIKLRKLKNVVISIHIKYKPKCYLKVKQYCCSKYNKRKNELKIIFIIFYKYICHA